MRQSLRWTAILLVAGCGGSGASDGEDSADGAMAAMDSGADASDASDANMDATSWVPTDGGGVMVVPDASVVLTEDGGSTYVCQVFACAGHITECGDCEDNDIDGRIDSRDPECLGPCDNTEGPLLTTGVGGETGGPCRADCYFDYGNGAGNDDCHWNTHCDPLEVAPSYNPEGEECEYDPDAPSVYCPDEQSAQCLEICIPLTPAGCDCFGCCTFDEIAGRSAASGGEYVWLGSVERVEGGTNIGTCTLAEISDPERCRPCTPVMDCYDPCGECELCFGRTAADLPEHCFESPDVDGGVSTDGGSDEPRCTLDRQPCGLPGDEACPFGYYCISGCCRDVVF